MAPDSKGGDPTSPSQQALRDILKKESENAEAFDDDDEDLDDELAQLQRTQSAKRREAKDLSHKSRIQELLGITFAPNCRPLGVSDLQSVVALENAAFPDPEHRATADKFQYRLTVCPELSLGIFLTVAPGQVKDTDIFATFDTAHPVETGRPDQARSVLLAQIIATASNSATVQDNDMDIPANWKTSPAEKGVKGHVEGGRTICLHSLSVSPKLQGCGLGKLVMKSFLQHMKALGYERVALLCQEYLVGYYERFGYKHAGKSDAKFGGGGWHDMVFDFSTVSAAANASSP